MLVRQQCKGGFDGFGVEELRVNSNDKARLVLIADAMPSKPLIQFSYRLVGADRGAIFIPCSAVPKRPIYKAKRKLDDIQGALSTTGPEELSQFVFGGAI